MSSQPNSLPLQWASLTPEHFKTQEGIDAVNQQMLQIVNAVNRNNGVGGKVTLPHGIDVRGATVSGVGAPQSDSDAISSGHAQSQFSAPVLSPQLDIGGKNTLKGLTGLYLQINQLTAGAISGTVVLAKITGGGSNGSLTFTNGVITGVVDPT